MDSLFVGSYEGGLMSTSGSWKGEKAANLSKIEDNHGSAVQLPAIQTENVVNKKGAWKLAMPWVHGPPQENEDVLKHMKADHRSSIKSFKKNTKTIVSVDMA